MRPLAQALRAGQPAAIIPAHNEQATVAAVAHAVRAGGLRAIVVDDGSTDRTAREAKQAGAEVVQTEGLGKAEAMQRGLERTLADPVAFFDADLIGLRAEHVRKLRHAAEIGYDHVCGLRDYGTLVNPLQLLMPLITGQRIVRQHVLRAIPADCWRGYAIETAINRAVDRTGGRTALVYLQGVTGRTKRDKIGSVQGWVGETKMMAQIARTEMRLRYHGRCA